MGRIIIFIISLSLFSARLIPKNGQSLDDVYPPVSPPFLYLFATSWSVSFYPQVLLNFSRGTSVGLSFDFLLYNVLAFSCYSAFTCETPAFRFRPPILPSRRLTFEEPCVTIDLTLRRWTRAPTQAAVDRRCPKVLVFCHATRLGVSRLPLILTVASCPIYVFSLFRSKTTS